MHELTQIKCACGQTVLDVHGAPISSVECCCTSCREAGERIQRLEGAPRVLTEHGTTPFVMYRKDRVRFVAGTNHLREIRLSPEAKTRRVIATCCNTPAFVEFAQGHWLSLFAGLWAPGTCPPSEMRTMAGDLPSGSKLPEDMPNAKTHSLGFCQAVGRMDRHGVSYTQDACDRKTGCLRQSDRVSGRLRRRE